MQGEFRVCRVCERKRHIDRYYRSTNKQGREYRRRVCASCYHRKRVKKRVELTEMRPFVREIVHRCGGIRPAATRIGTTPMVVRRWLGISLRYDGGKRYRDKRMDKSSATVVMTVLRELRREQVFFEHHGGYRPPWLSVDDRDAKYKRDGRVRRAAA